MRVYKGVNPHNRCMSCQPLTIEHYLIKHINTHTEENHNMQLTGVLLYVYCAQYFL